ncbi:MAG: hypothetical protein LBF76_02095 [Holosporales bacterium]|jgi:hypothetical protein|nr:hypothetical protein [Holosporales bacterium]
MGITYRNIKGAPLTSAEVDANFAFLDQRLNALERAQERPSGLISIEQQDQQLRFLDPSGKVLGIAILPTPRFVPKGAWQTTQIYEQGDLVAHEAHTWCATHTHEAVDFEKEKSQGLWRLFL